MTITRLKETAEFLLVSGSFPGPHGPVIPEMHREAVRIPGRKMWWNDSRVTSPDSVSLSFNWSAIDLEWSVKTGNQNVFLSCFSNITMAPLDTTTRYGPNTFAHYIKLHEITSIFQRISTDSQHSPDSPDWGPPTFPPRNSIASRRRRADNACPANRVTPRSTEVLKTCASEVGKINHRFSNSGNFIDVFSFFPWDAYGIEASGWSLAELLHWFWWQIHRKAKWWQNDSKMRSLSPIFSVLWCLWSSTARSLASQISEFFWIYGIYFWIKNGRFRFGKFSHVAAIKNRQGEIPRLVAVATLPSIRSTMGTVTLSERPRIKIHLSSTKPQELWNQMTVWQSSYESFQFQCFFLGKLDTKLRRAPTFVTMKVAPKPQVMAAAQAEFWVAPIPGSDAAPVHCWPEKNHGFCHASKDLIWNLNSSPMHWSYSISVSLFQHVPMVFFICQTIQHLIVCISLMKIFEESLPPGVVYVWSQGPSCPSRSP